MGIEIDKEDQEQLDQLLEQRKQISEAIAQIEMQKKQLDKREENLVDNFEQSSTNLQSKLAEIQRVYDVDETYSYDKVSGELIKTGE